MTSQQIYQLRAELNNFEPKIHRTFQVDSSMKMVNFGYLMMVLFEMEGYHLFSFNVPLVENFKICAGDFLETKENQETLELLEKEGKKVNISLINEKDFVPVEGVDFIDAKGIELQNVIAEIGEKLEFLYDYTEGWSFDITLEKVEIATKKTLEEMPKILAGSGFGIIEHCGGVAGLAEKRAEIMTKSGEVYEDICAYLDVKTFEFDSLNLERMNDEIVDVINYFIDIYEVEMPVEDKWKLIAEDSKKIVLENVFCSKCGVCNMVDFTMQNDELGILLQGKCDKCGEPVARLLEM